MAWPYRFIDLTPEEKHARRESLDRHALYAQASVIFILLILVATRHGHLLVKLFSRKQDYDVVPHSPVLKRRRLSAVGTWNSNVRKTTWWLSDEVVLAGQRWGPRDEWIFGTAWTFWLLFMCVVGTGNDYLHLTKRFGIIATSQFPIQYLLSNKILNPFAFVLRSSHEEVNRWHRVIGRIIVFLLCLHAAFYLNFFILSGILTKRLQETIVVLGILSFMGILSLNTTTLAVIRSFSYRVFFVTHIIVAIGILPMLFFHAHHARMHEVIAFLAFGADLATRKILTITVSASLESIPGTNLVKIVLSVPATRIDAFRGCAASHVYLSVPAAARPSSNPLSRDFWLYEFLFNPFTIAAIDEESRDLTLVARRLSGPMTRALSRLANANHKAENIPLSIEGPYGTAIHFPDFAGSDFDRILLVAGGIGATFILPIYRSILQENPAAKVELAWAIRTPGDATWAMTGSEVTSIMDDNNVQLYLTGNILDGESDPPASNGSPNEIELSTLPQNSTRSDHASRQTSKRPDLQKIVDNTFRHGAEDRVAVLVCGPVEMGLEVRKHVRSWVMTGRDVWWHNESFGW